MSKEERKITQIKDAAAAEEEEGEKIPCDILIKKILAEMTLSGSFDLIWHQLKMSQHSEVLFSLFQPCCAIKNLGRSSGH